MRLISKTSTQITALADSKSLNQETKQNANCAAVGTASTVSDSCNQAQNNSNVNDGGIKTTGKQVSTTGTLVIIKHVINDNGGSSTAKDFTLA